MQSSIYKSLKDSFEKNFIDKDEDVGVWKSLFDEIVEKLEPVEIEHGYVDIGFKKKIIDFNLCLNDKWFMSIAKTLDDESEEVMFTIDKDGKTLVIGWSSIDDVLSKYNELKRGASI